MACESLSGELPIISLSAGREAPKRRQLSAPVGVGQPNRRWDVLIVQQLLNRSRTDDPDGTPLPETGQFDVATQLRLVTFQHAVVHLRRADGVIGLPGPTDRVLHRLLPSSPPKSALPFSFASPSLPLAEDVISPGGDLHQLLLMKAAQPKNPKKRAFFDELLIAAGRTKIRWGTPISTTLGQAAVESQWGTIAPRDNFFGVKGVSPHGESQQIATHEQIGGKLVARTATFRAYESIAEGVDDYAHFLRSQPRYAAAFAFTSEPLRFLRALCEAGYATLGVYYQRVSSVILFNGLLDFDKVRLGAGPIYTDAVSIGRNIG